MFGFREDAIPTPCEPGVTRRILVYSDQLMMCEISFEKGAEGNPHHHPHEQITYVGKGAFSFTVGEETKVVRAGDSVLMPPDVPHHVVCLEEGFLVDVFCPKRDDFLAALKK